MKKDRKLRNKLIKEECDFTKYLIKNDFDPQKGFIEFLHELNKSMFFKITRYHEDEDFCLEVFDKLLMGFTWKDSQHLKRISLKTLVVHDSKNEEVQYFKNLSTKIKNQDFDEVIARWLRTPLV